MSGGGEDDDADKAYDPTQKRLDDARQRGEFARSQDLLTAAAVAGFVLVSIGSGGDALLQAGAAAMVLIDQPAELSDAMSKGGQPIMMQLLGAVLMPLMPFFLVPAVAVITVLAATKGIVFNLEKLAPKLSRISPMATAKQKFGLDGLIEFGKSTAKLVIISLLIGWFLVGQAPIILHSFSLEPALALTVMLRLLSEFILLVLLILVVIGGLDFCWQFFRHLQRNRMSRKEMTDEMKDAEGDPHVKGQRRQRAQDIATNQMLADVPTADVIIVNPTHYAVALKWKRGSRTAPICVAKGVDEIAARIRERAAAAGVPLHSDPPTARAIHATVKIGMPIAAEHFKAVAAAIRFAEAMRARARKSGTQL
jgi:flagellar biosynthesis protein FlhB